MTRRWKGIGWTVYWLTAAAISWALAFFSLPRETFGSGGGCLQDADLLVCGTGSEIIWGNVFINTAFWVVIFIGIAVLIRFVRRHQKITRSS